MFFGGSPVIPIPSLRIPMIFLWFSYDIPNIGPDVFWGESCHSYPVTEDSNDFPVIFLWYSKYRTRCFSYPVTEDSNDFPVIVLWYSKYRTRCFLGGVLSFLSRHWGFQWFPDFPIPLPGPFFRSPGRCTTAPRCQTPRDPEHGPVH